MQPLDSHAHRSLLLYLYLSALEPLLDGLGEWLWASGTSAATATATATASATASTGTAGAAPGGAGGGGAGATAAWLAGEGGASACGCELPADFFIVRGGQPGREVPPDHPSFWREGYLALRRPEQAAAAAAAGVGALPVTGPGAGAEAGVAEGVASAGGTAGAAGVGVGAGGGGGGYTCPPFLEPLVASIMAAGGWCAETGHTTPYLGTFRTFSTHL